MRLSHIEYKNYAITMGKNHCRPLSWGRLERHLDGCDFRSHKNSFLAGQSIDWQGISVFCPSHFFPASQRDGLELLRQLLDADEPIVFAVLPKMGRMLEKIGYVFAGRLEVNYPTKQEKVLYVNNVDLVPAWWSNWVGKEEL